MTVKKSVMESLKEYVFSFKLRVCLAFAINGSEEACDGSGFRYRLQRSPFLIKLQAFTVTRSEGVCNGVCV